MKASKRFLVMMVASLLMSTSVWAGGTVTIVKKLNGTVNENAGRVNVNVDEYEQKCLLLIVPDAGNYVTVANITAERIIDAGFAQARRRAPEISNLITVKADDANADPSELTSYRFDMPGDDCDVEVTIDFQTRTSISTGTLTLTLPEEGYFFDGTAKKPAVTVMLDDTKLSDGDYAVSYTDSINAGTATVTVTGKKTYTGTLTQTYTINRAELSLLSVSIEGWTYGEYDEELNMPHVSGNEGGGEETITYRGIDEDVFSENPPTDAGKYVIKVDVAETENYVAGSATAEFTISKAELGEEVSVTIDGWTYGDEPNAPAVEGAPEEASVSYTYFTFVDGEEQELETVPTNAGSYAIKATIGESLNYLGRDVYNEFTIAQASLALVTIEAIADQDYTGEAIEPTVVVKFNGNEVSDDEYTVIYENNINPGTATVKLSTKNVNFSEPDIQPSQTFMILGTEISMNGHTWITYVAPTTMTIPDGLKAYKVSSVNGRSVIAEEIDRLPQATAILIQEVEVRDQYVATPWRGESDFFESLLRFRESNLSVLSLIAENDIYVLYNNEFVRTTSGQIPAYRGYLSIAKGEAPSSRLAIAFDNETTALTLVKSEKGITNSEVYDLQGRKVAQPTKGLYVINGKKVVVK